MDQNHHVQADCGYRGDTSVQQRTGHVVQSDWLYNTLRYNLMTLKRAGRLLKRGPARLILLSRTAGSAVSHHALVSEQLAVHHSGLLCVLRCRCCLVA